MRFPQTSFPRPPGAVLWLPKNQHNSDGLTNKSTPYTKFYNQIIIYRYQVSSLGTPQCIVVIYWPKYFKAVTILFVVSSQNRQIVGRQKYLNVTKKTRQRKIKSRWLFFSSFVEVILDCHKRAMRVIPSPETSGGPSLGPRCCVVQQTRSLQWWCRPACSPHPH